MLRIFPRKWVALLVLVGCQVSVVTGQVPESPDFDPSDVYFQAYLAVRSAENMEKDEDFSDALKKYQHASELFGAVGKYYPDWQSRMVRNRLEMTKQSIEGVRQKAGEQIQRDNKVIAELEGGQKVGADKDKERENLQKPDRNILEVDAVGERKLEDAEAEVARLKQMISQAEAKELEATKRAREAEQRRDEAAKRAKDEEFKRMQASQQAREAETQKKAALARAAMEEKKRKDAMSNPMTEEERKSQELREAQANADAAAAEALRATAEAQAKSAAEREARAKAEEARAGADASDAMRNQENKSDARIEDLLRTNQALTTKLKAAEEAVRSLRAQMATAPVRGEMYSLDSKIKNLEQEREVMAMALKSSRQDHTKAMSEIEILTTDVQVLKDQAKELRQKEANLERDLKKERGVANEVVAGQRRQLERLELELGEKTKQLKTANDQIAGLNKELEQAHAAFAEMKEERDVLLRDKEQLSALLKLNEGGRIEQLIEQNMGLAKQLREANNKLEMLSKDGNAAKDDLVNAQRDLAIAKSMINRLQQDKKAQDKRIEDLKKQLEGEEKALANGEVTTDAAEVEILREVIRRQLRMQERRRQAKELLVEATKDWGKEDSRLEEAIALFDMGEIELTPNEQKLVADQQVDGEFVSPFARDSVTVGKATKQLNTELESYDRAASKAYLAGRLLPTRELYSLMLEQHPGHVPALCKLGVVHLKLNEMQDAAMSFQKAIELDEGNAYAMRMLGYCHYKMDDMETSDSYLRKAVDMAPDDAKSHLLLGIIAFQLGSLNDAESHFKGAITADPVSSDAYFNLAKVQVKTGKLDAARKSYRDALERGELPDEDLEKQLTIKR